MSSLLNEYQNHKHGSILYISWMLPIRYNYLIVMILLVVAVCTEVFEHFRRGNEFFSFVGQSTEAVTGMYNLYRASQLRFPEETILEDANKYSSKFLGEKREANDLLDKWIVTKDLPGEVMANLPTAKYTNFSGQKRSRQTFAIRV